MKDLIIIGSGPAGLAAAVYAQRACLNTLVLEKAPMSGGQIISTESVDNYPGLPGINGFDMGIKMREHADLLGAQFMTAEMESLEKKADGSGFVVHTDKEDLEAKALILAMGASHSKLGVPGEDRFLGRGVSYCATCDGAFFRDKAAVVVGGGDVAVEDALFLAKGCSKVYLVHRRDSLRAAKILQEQLFAEKKIEVLWNSVVTEILGDEKVNGVIVRNVKSDSAMKLNTNAAFIAVGIVPLTERIREFVQCDEKGFIIAGEDTETSEKGIFAAGDIRTKKLRQVITASADGAVAVTMAGEYLSAQGR